MALISLGKIDINLIPILIGCIFCFLNRLLNQYDGALLLKNAILTNIFISISKLFTVIPLLILKFRSNKVSSSEIQSVDSFNKLEYIYTEKNIEIVQYKGRLILLSAVIFFVQSIFFVLTFGIKTNSWIWNILITSIFYYWFFKIKLFKHHYLSIIIIILIGFIIDLVLKNLQNDISDNLTLFLFRFLREILYSFHDVINKYIMEKKFGSIYEIALSNGIITLILLLIFAVLDYNFFGLDDYEEYFNNFNGTELLVIFGVMITQLGLYLSLMITNRNYTPCHLFIIFVFGQLAYYIDFSGISIIVLLCLIFILFMALIFNEIIELNFCGLSDNTKRKISERAEIDSDLDSMIDKNSTINSFDDFDENNDNNDNISS